MKDLAIFDFESLNVRVVTRDGEPWFVAADVCRVLELANAPQAVRALDDDERTTITNNDSRTGPKFGQNGASRSLIIINESGLYALILKSRKPAAKRFRKWVTAEVLPAIRRTGGYVQAAPDESPEALVLRAMTVLQDTVERQKRQLAEAQPKADGFERIAEANGSLTLTDAAKALQLRLSRNLH